MKITWLGTASVKLETAATTLLIDPFIQCRGGEHRNSVHDFVGADGILITHCHLDHLASMPKILRREQPPVYCTGVAAKHFRRGCATRIAQGDRFAVGDIDVAVYSGKHIEFDKQLVSETLSVKNMLRRPDNVLPLLFTNMRYKENDETVLYELTVGGVRVQDMGSLALRDGVDYPTGADVLLLPYQGSSHLNDAAEAVLRRLMPRRVIATHFDNAFPPVSKTIDTSPLVRMMAEKFPGIPVTVPEYGKPIEI